MIKAGDLVKYHIESDELYILGYVLGRVYTVKESPLGLVVTPPRTASTVAIIDAQGEMTDHADHFTLFKPVQDLPKGLGQ